MSGRGKHSEPARTGAGRGRSHIARGIADGVDFAVGWHASRTAILAVGEVSRLGASLKWQYPVGRWRGCPRIRRRWRLFSRGQETPRHRAPGDELQPYGSDFGIGGSDAREHGVSKGGGVGVVE